MTNQTTPFKTTVLNGRLGDFYRNGQNGMYQEMRIVREPGAFETFLITTTDSEEIIETFDPQEFEQENGVEFAKVLHEVILDSFGVPEAEDDEETLGDKQAEELFLEFVKAGMALLENSPYFEIAFLITILDDGINCTVTLSRISQVENQQRNTILAQFAYPLAAIQPAPTEDQTEESNDNEIS